MPDKRSNQNSFVQEHQYGGCDVRCKCTIVSFTGSSFLVCLLRPDVHALVLAFACVFRVHVCVSRSHFRVFRLRVPRCVFTFACFVVHVNSFSRFLRFLLRKMCFVKKSVKALFTTLSMLIFFVAALFLVFVSVGCDVGVVTSLLYFTA